jgi:hypothetical protein
VDGDLSSVPLVATQVAEVDGEPPSKMVRPGSLATLRLLLCMMVSSLAIGLKDRDLIVATISSIK